MSKLLFLAHPGHELLLHDWIGRHSPTVAILTDGSGGSGIRRTDASRSTVEAQSGRILEPFGSFPDELVYRAILTQDVSFFRRFADELLSAINRLSIDTVVSDQAEHCNPVHDLCCALATLLARRLEQNGTPILRLACPIEIGPLGLLAYEHELSPAAQAAKREAALRTEGLQSEVERFQGTRASVFEREVLVAIDLNAPIFPELEYQPFYELYGAMQLQRRGGGELITYRNHVLPLAERLERDLLSA